MFQAKGLLTVEDLLFYVPFRYEDRSNVKSIAQLAPGEMATVIAEVRSAKVSGFQRRSLGLFEARFSDASRVILAGKWFHGGYLANVLAPGQKIALFGKVEFDSYSGEQLQVTGEQPYNSDVIVQTKIIDSKGEPTTLNYRMGRGQGAPWQISDVYLDGTISQLAVHRREIALGLLSWDVRLQSRHDGKVVKSSLGRFLRPEHPRHEDIDIRDRAERGRHDAGDREDGAIERDRAASHV